MQIYYNCKKPINKSRKFIENPPSLRFIHAKTLADFIGLKTQDIVDTIVYDLN